MKQSIGNYFILCARLLLAFTFLTYGWGKLNHQQFGISPSDLAKPVKEIGLFKLSWYLFDQQPFKTFIGIAQILTALLLIYNRTLLIGALMALPILLNILVIDITYIKMTGFYWRIGYYILLDIIIIYQYKDVILPFLRNLIDFKINGKRFPTWAYLILPISVFITEFLIIFPKLIIGMLINPNETLSDMQSTLELLSKYFSNFL